MLLQEKDRALTLKRYVACWYYGEGNLTVMRNRRRRIASRIFVSLNSINEVLANCAAGGFAC